MKKMNIFFIYTFKVYPRIHLNMLIVCYANNKKHNPPKNLLLHRSGRINSSLKFTKAKKHYSRASLCFLRPEAKQQL